MWKKIKVCRVTQGEALEISYFLCYEFHHFMDVDEITNEVTSKQMNDRAGTRLHFQGSAMVIILNSSYLKSIYISQKISVFVELTT